MISFHFMKTYTPLFTTNKKQMSIFAINLQDTCACSEKYSNKLDISRSLISIFAVKL